jgi:hypothetical protein
MPTSADGTLAEAVAAGACAVPGVARLSGGKAGQVATYLPGRRVSGVRVTGDSVEVHLVARWVASLPQLAQDVRAALDPLVAGRAVTVFVEDIESAVLEPPSPARDPLSTTPTAPDSHGEISWAKSVI